MEKCTYCIQRLTNTRIDIEKMILQIEDRQKSLRAESETATPQRRQQIDRQIDEFERQRHNDEFGKLEQLRTACQQGCPTGAIQFGHLLPVEVVNEIGQREPRLTHVAKLKQEPLDYPILADLTTKPRTTYMGRLRNPNPDLEPEASA
jgi:Fe-S-cluster-containing dehydrogenase component